MAARPWVATRDPVADEALDRAEERELARKVDVLDLDVTVVALALGIDLGDAGQLDWQDRALCAQTDPEAFFPEKGGSTREAKKVCRTCEVRAECLEYALEHGEKFGIWGGLSERERNRITRGFAA